METGAGELFGLAEVPALSRSTVERDDEVRRDTDRLAELWTKGQVLLVDRQGRTPVRFPAPGGADAAEVADENAEPGAMAGQVGASKADVTGQTAAPSVDASAQGPVGIGAAPGQVVAAQADAADQAGGDARSGAGKPIWARTRSLAGSVALNLRSAADVRADRPEDAVLLGTLDGTAYWSVPADEAMSGEALPPPNSWGLWPGARSTTGEEWHDLRAVGGLLDDTGAGLFTTAVAVHGWHARARFCARCGERVERTAAGWAARCVGCGREEYPRTDPAVICLVHDGVGANGEQVLLARQPVWPPDRYSVLAGFVEAGESLEACVEREVAEEVGVAVDGVRYLGSQPWPFPRSVMIAFTAHADPAAPLRMADGEIEDARWVSRADVRAALDAGGDGPGLKLPGATSIAGQMLAGWALAAART